MNPRLSFLALKKQGRRFSGASIYRLRRIYERTIIFAIRLYFNQEGVLLLFIFLGIFDLLI